MNPLSDSQGRPEQGAEPARQAAKAVVKESGAQPPEKKKEKGPGKKGAAKQKREALAAELSVELAKVRGLLKESADNLMTRLDGELAALTLYLSGQAVHEEKPVLPPSRVLSCMVAEAKALKVKPQKGRLKDIGRIEALLDSLASKMPPGS